MKQSILSARQKIAEGISEMIEALITENIGSTDLTLLKVPDVAKLLNVAEDTVRSCVHREADPIPVCHVGSSLRFRRSEVLEWAGRQRPKNRPVKKDPESPKPVRRVTPIGVRKATKRTNCKAVLS